MKCLSKTQKNIKYFRFISILYPPKPVYMYLHQSLSLREKNF